MERENQEIESQAMTLAPSTLETRAQVWRESLVERLTALADEAKAVTIKGHVGGEKAGAKEVNKMRLRLRSNRLPIQNEAKAMKDLARSTAKKIGEIENELIAIIEGDEKRLQAEEDTYEAEQDRIKRAEQDLKKQITAERFIQMQALDVRPLDFALCESCTEAMWEEHVVIWEEQKARADREKERERLRLEKEAAEAKAAADALKAKEDAERAENDAQLAAEREKNRLMQERLDKIEADAKAKEQAEDKARKDAQARIDAEAKEKREAAEKEAREKAEREQMERELPDLEKLNNWRLEIQSAIDSVSKPSFESANVAEVFDSELKLLLSAVPEIYPFI